MTYVLVLVFVLAYLGIAFEHFFQVNKSASALLGAGVLWTIYALMSGDASVVSTKLDASLTATAQVVFFLMGAMTIVEVMDAHDGFEVITSRIHTQSLSGLMWVIALVTFFLSSILDNLTTTIVMISLAKRLLGTRDDRLKFAGLIVIAANAGGAWSPIGDVTTTMLWIGGQITGIEIMKRSFLPSLISLLVPLTIMTRAVGTAKVTPPEDDLDQRNGLTTPLVRNLMFFLGVGVLLLVPAFKSVTHLPPYMGILLGLGLLWAFGDLVHKRTEDLKKQRLTIARALTRIDMSSLVFFIGILMAVSVLEHAHILSSLAHSLEHAIGRVDVIVLVIGLFSSIVDNVPLVAASMGMFDMASYPPDSFLWEFLAYCAGTGGSILIIGSAAGVAAMGLEKISFGWYLRNISGYALLGYFSGAVISIVQHSVFL